MDPVTCFVCKREDCLDDNPCQWRKDGANNGQALIDLSPNEWSALEFIAAAEEAKIIIARKSGLTPDILASAHNFFNSQDSFFNQVAVEDFPELDESRVIQVLTLDQHREAVRLGIAQRKDGLWGFKKKCVNEKCDKVIENTCYSTATFEEAVWHQTEVPRSAYACSLRCNVNSGSLWPWLSEVSFDDLAVKAKPEQLEKISKAVQAQDFDRLTEKQKEILKEWVAEEAQNWDGEPDEAEDACEV